MSSQEQDATTTTVAVSSEDPGTIEPISSTDAAAKLSAYQKKLNALLSDLPKQFGDFFGEYRKTIVIVALILGTIVLLRVLFAVLDAVSSIPLLSPLLELVGLAYSSWFVWRYLLQANTRQELTQQFQSYKKQVLGD